MTQKIIAVSFLAVALIFGFIAFDPLGVVDFDLHHGLRRKNSFSDQISEDLYFLKKKKILPESWDSIQYVAYNFHNDFQRQLVGHRKFDIKEDPQGRYRLEIEFIDVPDETAPAIILQMSLFDIDSNNKVFEIGRTHSVVPYLVKKKTDKKIPQVPASATAPAAATPAATPPPAEKPPASPPPSEKKEEVFKNI